MEESFLFFLLSYTFTPVLSQREREFIYRIWHTGSVTKVCFHLPILSDNL